VNDPIDIDIKELLADARLKIKELQAEKHKLEELVQIQYEFIEKQEKWIKANYRR
jgi:hypothetical protein